MTKKLEIYVSQETWAFIQRHSTKTGKHLNELIEEYLAELAILESIESQSPTVGKMVGIAKGAVTDLGDDDVKWDYLKTKYL
ncbi:MAG: DUF6364 family protein [Bacteroidota bacterium]